ncbi:MAG TPA: acyl carrier protein [Azospirillaceae bacterium]|nr:acyl carrier protein [Azospirillaceae bacterium]
MTEFAHMVALVTAETEGLLRGKGVDVPPIGEDSQFLDGDLPMDSLDLATLLVMLEERTGRDPFREGFRSFTTVGELARLYVTG